MISHYKTRWRLCRSQCRVSNTNNRWHVFVMAVVVAQRMNDRDEHLKDVCISTDLETQLWIICMDQQNSAVQGIKLLQQRKMILFLEIASVAV